MTYDLAIIGGGPAGVAAGVYAARKQLRAVLITNGWGGQSIVSEDIQNWIGTKSITGMQLADNLRDHLKAYAGTVVDIQDSESVQSIGRQDDSFAVRTEKGCYTAKTVLVASGSQRRRLEIPGADTFEHKGLTYCASCDGPMFSGTDTAVIGGGNAGFETAAQLLAYAKSVTLLHRSAAFKADPVTVAKVTAHPNMTAIANAEPVEVKGDKFVDSLVYKMNETGETREIPVKGIFVEIGHIPNTGFAKDLVELNEFNQIKVDPRTQRSSLPGIWAAGDVTDGLYHQNNIAVGDAVKALEDIYLFLRA